MRSFLKPMPSELNSFEGNVGVYIAASLGLASKGHVLETSEIKSFPDFLPSRPTFIIKTRDPVL